MATITAPTTLSLDPFSPQARTYVEDYARRAMRQDLTGQERTDARAWGVLNPSSPGEWMVAAAREVTLAASLGLGTRGTRSGIVRVTRNARFFMDVAAALLIAMDD